MSRIHAKHVYTEINGVYCNHCKKWASRSNILFKLRGNPVASCSKCKAVLFETVVGERTTELINDEVKYKQTLAYIN